MSEPKKNPNYEESAVNLCNPSEVKQALDLRENFVEHISNLKAVMEAYPEWEDLRMAEMRLSELDQDIRTLITQFGSYQDLELGRYGIKQRKLSRQYSAEGFEKLYPDYAAAVIKKAVDTVKLTALVKGGLITEEALRSAAVLTETETFSFIIR